MKHLLLGFFTVFLLYVLYSLPTENRGLYILFLSPISFIFFYTVTDFVMYGHLSDLKMKTIKNMKKERLQELFQIYRNKEKSKKEVLKVVKDVGKFTSEFDEWIKQIKTEIEEIKKDS